MNDDPLDLGMLDGAVRDALMQATPAEAAKWLGFSEQGAAMVLDVLREVDATEGACWALPERVEELGE